MIHFYFKLSRFLPIVKNNCLQDYDNISTEKYQLDNCKSSKI